MNDSHRMLRLLQGDVAAARPSSPSRHARGAGDRPPGGNNGPDRDPGAPAHGDHRGDLRAAAVNVVVLTGATGKARKQTLEAIADGRIQIVIGTHALIQPDVVFHQLALVVVDEQHRFGVDERATLTAKGQGVDTLVMSADPIPRSLTLAAYGDMDVSRLDEKPPAAPRSSPAWSHRAAG